MIEESNKEKNALKEYFQLGELGGYFFRKKDSKQPKGFSLKAMHFVNKLSILMFLAGLIYMIFKYWV